MFSLRKDRKLNRILSETNKFTKWILPAKESHIQVVQRAVQQKFKQEADNHILSHDLARLLKNIQITSVSGDILSSRPTSKQPTRELIKLFLLTLSNAIGDVETANKVEEVFTEHPNNIFTIFGELQHFLQLDKVSSSATKKVLLLINQSIIAPIYLEIKKRFEKLKKPVTDVNGTWNIDITILTNTGLVQVVHSKRARSTSSEFSFSWFLSIFLQTSDTEIGRVIPYIEGLTVLDPTKNSEKIRKLTEKWKKPSLSQANSFNSLSGYTRVGKSESY